MENETQNSQNPEIQTTPFGDVQVDVQESANTKQKSFLVIGLIILVLILLGSTSYHFYQNYQLKQQIAQKQALPTPTLETTKQAEIPSPTPTVDSTTDWKVYTNTEYRFQVIYPKFGEIQDLSCFENDGYNTDKLTEVYPPLAHYNYTFKEGDMLFSIRGFQNPGIEAGCVTYDKSLNWDVTK